MHGIIDDTNPITLAWRRCKADSLAGKSVREIPVEYRPPSRTAEASAWLDGWFGVGIGERLSPVYVNSDIRIYRGNPSLRWNPTLVNRVEGNKSRRRRVRTTLPMLVVIAAFTGTIAYAQQSGSGPQTQPPVPVTPEGTPPPAEITPAHPLNGPNMKMQRGGNETTGAAPRGRADAKPSKNDLRRDREHLH